MNSVFDNYRYQLVYPIQSTTIQIAKNIANGSKKCYNELKTNNLTPPLFIVHSLDTNELYHYEIPKYKKNIDLDNTMIVGEGVYRDDVQPTLPKNDSMNAPPNVPNNYDQCKEKTFENIIRRLEILENKVNSIV